MERPPAAYAVASLALLYLDPEVAAVVIPSSIIIGSLLVKRFPWPSALGAALIGAVGAYTYPVLSLISFMAVLYADPALSFAPLPFAVLAAAGVPAVSPLLGGYPSSVRAGVPAWLVPALSLPQCLSLGGSASLLGYALGSLIAPLLDVLGSFCPNRPMIKLSTPIFIGIGAGIMINVVRVRVRLASGIRLKLRALRRGRAY
ncbi:MAG: hypothetical protein GXO07_03055 [Crenarchaeota archaeon]|nr:hypothetical protein [Thermoproteota archaeon]